MGINRSRKRSYIRLPEREKPTESWGRNPKLYKSNFWCNTSRAFKRKHKYCIECQRMGIDTPTDVVDHIDPIPPSATMEQFIALSKEEMMQGLCHNHHNQKTARERNEIYINKNGSTSV